MTADVSFRVDYSSVCAVYREVTPPMVTVRAFEVDMTEAVDVEPDEDCDLAGQLLGVECPVCSSSAWWPPADEEARSPCGLTVAVVRA
ncbi:MAG: hypothetical protein R3324_01530 [Halobacteriales archaeon]|nr:hypothetical protein [Halobacteriales archaeon]